MARAALGWGVRDLGKRAGVSANTISRFENDGGTTVETLRQIEQVLREEGIIFIEEDEFAGPGVRVKK